MFSAYCLYIYIVDILYNFLNTLLEGMLTWNNYILTFAEHKITGPLLLFCTIASLSFWLGRKSVLPLSIEAQPFVTKAISAVNTGCTPQERSEFQTNFGNLNHIHNNVQDHLKKVNKCARKIKHLKKHLRNAAKQVKKCQKRTVATQTEELAIKITPSLKGSPIRKPVLQTIYVKQPAHAEESNSHMCNQRHMSATDSDIVSEELVTRVSKRRSSARCCTIL